MLLKDFSGGLNTRVTPSLLAPNEAQVYTNIDNSSGALKGILDQLDTGIPIPEYYTYFISDDEWYGQDAETFFTEYNGKLYYTDGINELMVRKSGVSKPLGIAAPVDKPIVNPVILFDNNISFSESQIVGGLNSGAVTYKLVINSSVADTEFIKDIPYTVGNNDLNTYSVSITITNLDLEQVAEGDIITLYRNYSGGFYKVTSGTYSSGMVLTDSVLNIGTNTKFIVEIDKKYTYGYTYYNSSEGIESSISPISDEATYPVSIGGLVASTDVSVDSIRIYRIGGDLTSYTMVVETANTTATYTDYTTDVQIAGNQILNSTENTTPLVGMNYVGEAYAMLFAVKDSKLYYSDIGKPYAWPSTNFIDFPDIITGWGAVSTGLFVFTKYKTYIVTGNTPDTFSRYLLSGDQGCINHNTVQFVDNNLLWVSTDGLCISTGGTIQVASLPKLGKLTFNKTFGSAVLDSVYYLSYDQPEGNKIIAFDFRYNKIVRNLDLDGQKLVSALDHLYQYKTGTLQRLFDNTPMPIEYKSPILTDGSYSNLKRYKDIYVRHNGTATFNVYIDSILVSTTNLIGDTTTNIKLPSLQTSGYGIEFEVIGDIIVYEIEYKAEGRQKL